MVTKILHWCALRISDAGERLFDIGGALECWCDERIYERERKARIMRWKEWTGYDVIDIPLATLAPEDLAIPDFNAPYRVALHPLLDEYEGMTMREVYDKLKEQDGE